jgi:beta-galactosidase/beta-glucuronidase
MYSHRYPRPQLERQSWKCLNGEWEFAIDAGAQWASPELVVFDKTILVPFAPETKASGIEDTGLYNACWYRRTIATPDLLDDERLLLHFGAVDWLASVWVNGKLAVVHEGGYTPFKADITHLLTNSATQSIVLRAEDDPLDMAKPRGKQDWQKECHSIWYPRTTGIWQTVWMEKVGRHSIKSVHWSSDISQWAIGVSAEIDGPAAGLASGLTLSVELSLKDKILASDTYLISCDLVDRQIRLDDPGLDAARDEYLWTPENPTLLSARLLLKNADGVILDSVSSYTAMRSVQVDNKHFLLNGRPYDLRLVLDQGYWPDTGMTACDDAALRNDVELAKLMKFNGVRKHQKIEDPRFLYWADYLGLLVWEEMPSAYKFSAKAAGRLTSTWQEVIERDKSHPCIVAWVPFNESWGLPDLPKSASQRDYLRSVYYLTKTLDPSRPVIGNDGWEMVATDIIAIHDYSDAANIARRFTIDKNALELTLAAERPGGRALLLDGLTHEGRAIMLTEFGGICFSEREGAWGYKTASNVDEFAHKYDELLSTVRKLPLLSGFCYTQLTDTYQEANGLLYMDRKPKLPLDLIAKSTAGVIPPSFMELSQPNKKHEAGENLSQ